MKKIVLSLVAFFAVFGFGTAASAYPPVAPTVTVVGSPSVTPGGTAVLNVTGCAPGETIQVSTNGAGSTATADANGAATISTTAPTTPGPFTVSANCGGATTTVNLEVVAGDPPGTNGGTNGAGGTADGSLPATGSDGTNTALMLGLGALIVGGGMFGVSQIRRRQTLSA